MHRNLQTLHDCSRWTRTGRTLSLVLRFCRYFLLSALLVWLSALAQWADAERIWENTQRSRWKKLCLCEHVSGSERDKGKHSFQRGWCWGGRRGCTVKTRWTAGALWWCQKESSALTLMSLLRSIAVGKRAERIWDAAASPKPTGLPGLTHLSQRAGAPIIRLHDDRTSRSLSFCMHGTRPLRKLWHSFFRSCEKRRRWKFKIQVWFASALSTSTPTSLEIVGED